MPGKAKKGKAGASQGTPNAPMHTPTSSTHARSMSQGTPTALLKALEDTGRVRGSSATPQPQIGSPAILSPTAIGSQSFNDHIQKLQAMSLEEGPIMKGNSKIDTHTNASDSSGDGIDASSHDFNKPASLKQIASESQANYDKFVAMVRKAKLSSEDKEDLIKNAKDVSMAYRDNQKCLMAELTRITREKQHFETRLAETARHLQSTTTDRDRLRVEVITLRASRDNIQQEFNQRGNEIMTNHNEFRSNLERLAKKARVQEERIRGTFSPGGSASSGPHTPMSSSSFGNRSAPQTPMASSGMSSQRQPPLASPFKAQGSFQSASSPQSLSWQSSSGSRHPPMMSLPPLPRISETASSHGSHGRDGHPQSFMTKYSRDYDLVGITGSSHNYHTDPSMITNPGDSPLNPNYGAVAVVHENDVAPEFADDFTRIFQQVEGWVKDYANVGNPSELEDIMKKKDLWDYMLKCTYPNNKKDAHAHTLSLIKDRGCRYWFLMRMILAYIFDKMLSLEEWTQFSSDVDEVIDDVAAQLAKERGLPNGARQQLIERRAAAVKSVINDEDYVDWREQKLLNHSKNLRDMLGPFLNAGADRGRAGRDLGFLAIVVWDQSAKNNAAPITFQMIFPDTNSKFSAGSMFAKDRPTADPNKLQVKQVRVKLVITPVITMRDDSGTTIKAKSLHFANVLLMG